jgi:hypothetical protein
MKYSKSTRRLLARTKFDQKEHDDYIPECKIAYKILIQPDDEMGGTRLVAYTVIAALGFLAIAVIMLAVAVR